MSEHIKLYRPVGSKELALIEASGFTAFPPRLPEQPFFYPVLNEEYAIQIARDWNTKFDDRLGFVTRFTTHWTVCMEYEPRTVGGSMHEEYWVPAERLDEFNAGIVGKIEVIHRFTEQDRLAHEQANANHA